MEKRMGQKRKSVRQIAAWLLAVIMISGKLLPVMALLPWKAQAAQQGDTITAYGSGFHHYCIDGAGANRALIDGDGVTESKDRSEDNDKATDDKGVLSNTGNDTSDINSINTEQTDTLKGNESGKNLSEVILVPSPLKGRVVTLADTGDELFASEALGQGIAIEPETGEVIAPFAGTVSAVMGHAIGLECDNGLELLIHVGIDTVNLNGKGFDSKVVQGDHVEAGALLMKFDISLIREAGYPAVTPVIVTNSDEYAKVSGIAEDSVNQREPVMKIYQD